VEKRKRIPESKTGICLLERNLQEGRMREGDRKQERGGGFGRFSKQISNKVFKTRFMF
jgi:hypothetical protein